MRFAFAFLLSVRAFGAVAFVSNTTTDGSTAATTIAAPSLAVTGGNLLVVLASYYTQGTGQGVGSISDTTGNAFSQCTGALSVDSNNIGTDIWYVKNALADSNNTIVITFTASLTYRSIQVLQFSGVDATSPFEVAANGQTTPVTTVTSGSFSPAAANNVNVAIGTQAFTSTNNWSAGAGYTFLSSSGSNVNSGSEYQIGASSGAQTASISFTPAGSMQISVASFKEAGAVAVGIKHRAIQQ